MIRLFLLCLVFTGCSTIPARVVPGVTPSPTPLPPPPLVVPQAPSSSETCIVISLPQQHAWLFKHGEVFCDSPVCTGRAALPTPTGRFHVIDKERDWTSTLYHVPMPYLLRLNASNGEIGIHQGFIASRPSSHGCIRLPRDKAPVFFEATPIDSLVLIE